MQLIAATNNAHKLDELRRMLAPLGFTVLGMAEAGAKSDPEENGETFLDNARIKARAVMEETGLPALGDDSGLTVQALGGAPGVYSARYAGVHGDDKANNRKLLAELADVPEAERGGEFVCVLVLAMPDGRELAAEGRCPGHIGYEEKGTSGFGYDPLFYVDGVSFAQMGSGKKDVISHRSRAVAQLAQKLPAFLAEGSEPEK